MKYTRNRPRAQYFELYKAKETYDKAKETYDKARETYDKAKATYDTAKETYDTAKETYSSSRTWRSVAAASVMHRATGILSVGSMS